MSRLLDALAEEDDAIPHPLIGPFDNNVFRKSQEYSLVGYYANTLRLAYTSIQALHTAQTALLPPNAWGKVLPTGSRLKPALCARLAKRALAQSALEWQTECSLSKVPHLPDLREDWGPSAWLETPEPASDARSRHLDQVAPLPLNHQYIGLFGDGGFDPVCGATFSTEACCFGPTRSTCPHRRLRPRLRWASFLQD